MRPWIRLVAIAVALVACKDKATPSRPPPAPTTVVADASAVAPKRSSEVRADPRVELLSVICRLAGFEEYNRAKGTAYLDAVDAAFAPYAKHAAVTRIRTLRGSRGIGFDAPMLFAVHLDDNLALVNGDELATIDKRWTGVDAAALATDVRAFAKDSGFEAFRAKHAEYHASLVTTLEGVIAREDAVAWFDRVFGPAEASFVVVPSPIAGTMNFGPRATAADGKQHLYQVLGVGSKTGTIEVDEQLVGLLVHEMAHSYINPAFAKHEAELATSASKVFSLVEKQMRAQAYATWQIMVNESGVRAVVVNYMREKHGDAAGARAARAEQRLGFLWINELAEVMRQIAMSSDRDLEKHMPAIVEFWDKLAESYANGLPLVPFRGPVDAVHQRDPIWVVPANTQVAGYARMIHDRLKKTSPVVVASETTLRETRGKDLVAYGTPADNPVIDFVARSARWKIAKDSITLGDKTFTGPGLVLIACWYLRDSPSNGVAVYAAPDAASLVGINNVRHGMNDWLVARKQGAVFAILGAGDFPRGLDDMWMLPGETSTAPPLPAAAPR
ncbi:MAG: DUF4932 domain-containing protein [Kofleriaceae bacterium]